MEFVTRNVVDNVADISDVMNVYRWFFNNLKIIFPNTRYNEGTLAKIRDNASISTNKHYVDKVISDLIGSNRGYNKRPDPNVFLPKINEPYPKDLGSDVFKLVKKLIK